MIPWEDEGRWLPRLGKTSLILARRPGEALSDAAGVGTLQKSWTFGAIALLLITILGTGGALSVPLLGVGRLAAAGGLDDSAVALLTSLLLLLLGLTPLKLAALVFTHAVRAALFALGVRLFGARGRLREIAWLEGYLVIGAAPLALVLLTAALVSDPRVMTSFSDRHAPSASRGTHFMTTKQSGFKAPSALAMVAEGVHRSYPPFPRRKRDTHPHGAGVSRSPRARVGG